MKYILVTGGTGFLGNALCLRLLEDPDNFLFILVRSKGKQSGYDRVIKQFEVDMGEIPSGYLDRIQVMEGDIQSDLLGLDFGMYKKLTQCLHQVYHCAATIKFSLSYEEARKINCGGTSQILKLVKKIKNPEFDRLHYVGTAYIAGDITAGFAETDLKRNQKFNNTYEITKYKCEKMLQEEMSQGVPITIYRPSIVTNSSVDGSTHKNNIIYKFMKMFQSGRVGQFFCEEDSSINMVPIDYVIEGMLAIGKRSDTRMKTFHLVNSQNSNAREMIKITCQALNIELPEFLPYNRQETGNDSPLFHFFNYARLSHHFNDEYTRNLLLEGNIVCGQVNAAYLLKSIDYCKSKGLLNKN